MFLSNFKPLEKTNTLKKATKIVSEALKLLKDDPIYIKSRVAILFPDYRDLITFSNLDSFTHQLKRPYLCVKTYKTHFNNKIDILYNYNKKYLNNFSFTQFILEKTNKNDKRYLLNFYVCIMDNCNNGEQTNNYESDLYEYEIPEKESGSDNSDSISFEEVEIKINYSKDNNNQFYNIVLNIDNKSWESFLALENEHQLSKFLNNISHNNKTGDTVFDNTDFRNSIASHFFAFRSSQNNLYYLFSDVIKDAIKEKTIGLGGFYFITEQKIENDILLQLFISICDYIAIRITSNALQIDFLKQSLKTAIISILVDSYAHNISAHSLVALKWWFQKRAENIANKQIDVNRGKSLTFKNTKIETETLKKIAKHSTKLYENLDVKDQNNNDDYTTLEEIVKYYNEINKEGVSSLYGIEELFAFNDGGDEIARFPISLDTPLYHFFQFLRDKAAFWSGVTRDISFGGSTKNMYDVLWNDFAKNVLYLGSIAHSEGINKLKIQLELDDFSNEIKDETLANIDLSLINTENSDPKKENQYNFLQPGDDHKKIKRELEQIKVYFPGGIVGEHAFFTIIENQIRNIKHYKDVTEEINLNISIQKSWLLSDEKKPDDSNQLYKISIWLKHENDLVFLEDNKPVRIVDDLNEKAAKPILDSETNQTRMGGNSQDKICAAMLFNNTFSSVEKDLRIDENLKERDEYYCNKDNKNWVEFEEEALNDDKTIGYLKKSFYLWNAEEVATVVNIDKNDNLNRYKFVIAKDKEEKVKLRKQGIVRVIDGNMLGEYKSKEGIYTAWLKEFLGHKSLVVKVTKDDSITGVFKYNQKEYKYFYKYDIDTDQKLYPILKDESQNKPLPYLNINFIHSGQSETTINLRSHGVLAEKILRLKSLDNFIAGKEKISIKPFDYFEFFETIGTSISIYDNRINERLKGKNNKKNVFKDSLNLKIEGEHKANDFPAKEEILSKNFFVIHLSYLESEFKNRKNKDIKVVNHFIKEYLEIGKNGERIPDNFILIITTGRGRNEFWENLDEEYKQMVTFRPPESLLSAVEDALLLNDDFNLKYNLCKVLFGS